MSHDTKRLLSLAARLEFLATADLVKIAETGATKARNEAREKGLYYGWGTGWLVGTEAELKKKGVNKARKPDLDSNEAKDKKKLDPKAKVRNRGTVCVPAESAKDKKDHFPINSESQARNALARVHQYSSVPSWYSGSLKGLQDAVSRKVHSKYPGIGKADKKKKSASEFVDALMAKYGQQPMSAQPAVPNAEDLAQKMNTALAPYGYSIIGEVRPLPQSGYVDVPVFAGPKAKWKGTGNQAGELKKILDPLSPALPTKPVVSF